MVHWGPILAITGLPSDCKANSDGWRMVKDLVRAILVHHGIVSYDPNSKHGMVNMSYSSPEEPEMDKSETTSGEEHNKDGAQHKLPHNFRPKKKGDDSVTAHVNLRTNEEAVCVYRAIAGHHLWGYPLVAAIYYLSSTGMKKNCENEQPHDGEPSSELSDKYKISVPFGARTWNLASNGKIMMVENQEQQSRKRQHSPEEQSPKKKSRMDNPQSNAPNYAGLDCGRIADTVRQFAQMSLSPYSTIGFYGQYPKYGEDLNYEGQLIPYIQYPWGKFYMWPNNYSAQEEPVDNEMKPPIIISGDVEEPESTDEASPPPYY
ncbi:MAG: hypothetical protein Q9170_006609 [Blastenia crenularia]